MKNTQNMLALACILGLLAACNRAIPPAPTDVPPLATPIQAAAVPSTPAAPIPFASVDMIDETDGWARVWDDDAGQAHILVYHTQDGGSSWEDVTPQDLPILAYGGYFLDSNTAWVYPLDPATSASGLARTTDGGKTWTVMANDLEFLNRGDANILFVDQNTGWAETWDVGAGQAYVQLYGTQDGGSTWTEMIVAPPGPDTDPTARAIHLCNICGDGLYYDPWRIIITYGDMATGPGGAVRLARTTDLGKTWQNLNLALPSEQYKDDMVAPMVPVFFDKNNGALPVMLQKDNAEGMLSASLAIYGTKDGGASWEAAPAILNGVAVFASMDLVSLQDAFIVCGEYLCSTHDGAQSWQVLKSNLVFDINTETGGHVSYFDFINARAGWAITTNADGSQPALWRTSDGGETWTKLSAIITQ